MNYKEKEHETSFLSANEILPLLERNYHDAHEEILFSMLQMSPEACDQLLDIALEKNNAAIADLQTSCGYLFPGSWLENIIKQKTSAINLTVEEAIAKLKENPGELAEYLSTYPKNLCTLFITDMTQHLDSSHLPTLINFLVSNPNLIENLHQFLDTLLSLDVQQLAIDDSNNIEEETFADTIPLFTPDNIFANSLMEVLATLSTKVAFEQTSKFFKMFILYSISQLSAKNATYHLNEALERLRQLGSDPKMILKLAAERSTFFKTYYSVNEVNLLELEDEDFCISIISLIASNFSPEDILKAYSNEDLWIIFRKCHRIEPELFHLLAQTLANMTKQSSRFMELYANLHDEINQKNSTPSINDVNLSQFKTSTENNVSSNFTSNNSNVNSGLIQHLNNLSPKDCQLVLSQFYESNPDSILELINACCIENPPVPDLMQRILDFSDQHRDSLSFQ